MFYLLLNSHVTTKEKSEITFSPWADTQKSGESGSGSDWGGVAPLTPAAGENGWRKLGKAVWEENGAAK